MTDIILHIEHAVEVPEVYRQFPMMDYTVFAKHRFLKAARLIGHRDDVLGWARNTNANVAVSGIVRDPFTFELAYSHLVFLDDEDFALFKLTFPGRATIERNT